MSYGARMWASAALMSAAYTTVAFSQDVEWQLLGVVLSAVQGGLGEASCLAMCTFFDSRAAITLWSSGTGFAGKKRRLALDKGVSAMLMTCPLLKKREAEGQHGPSSHDMYKDSTAIARGVAYYMVLITGQMACNFTNWSHTRCQIGETCVLSRCGGIHMGGGDAHNPGLQLCDHADDSQRHLSSLATVLLSAAQACGEHSLPPQ